MQAIISGRRLVEIETAICDRLRSPISGESAEERGALIDALATVRVVKQRA